MYTNRGRIPARHDEAHRPRVGGIDLHVLDLERGRQKNLFWRRSNILF